MLSEIDDGSRLIPKHQSNNILHRDGKQLQIPTEYTRLIGTDAANQSISAPADKESVAVVSHFEGESPYSKQD